MKKYNNLFSPIKVNELVLRNRIAVAPMSFTVQNFDRGYPKEAIQMYERMAKGGAALITMGETVVGAGGKSHVDMIMLDEEGIERSLFLVSEACHKHGAAISVEISHGGAFAFPEFNNNELPLAPSFYSNAPGFSRGDGSRVRPMTKEDMDKVSLQFALAVKKVKDNGFDMAQIHFGHGWLIHQFLSPLFNNRTDEYGGSIENRMRFPLEILSKIREVVGWSFPLDVRISGTEVCEGYLEGGLDTPDVIEVCKAISKYVDLISVSCGGIHNSYTVQRMSPSIYMERNRNVYLAEKVRQALRADNINIPVSTVGAISEPEDMEKIIAQGRADICNMARALIADPDLPKKAKEGRENEILHCIRCSVCQHNISRSASRLARCTINPRVGFENEAANDPLIPATKKKKVVVVGGGPAGLTAAKTAAQRGHQVILLEAKNYLGGQLSFADYIPFKYDIKIYRDRLIESVKKQAGIEIRLNTRATKEILEKINPDACIVAIGATHKEPRIKGIEKAHVIYADELHGHESELGQKIAVIGGGLTGAETAIYLADIGKEVTIIGRRDTIASDASQAHNNATNYQLKKKTSVYTSSEVTEVNGKSLTFVNKTDGQKTNIDIDTVIIAVGMNARVEEALALEGNISEFRYIGDCHKASKIQKATFEGYYAAMDL